MPRNAPIQELTNSRSQILTYLNCGYLWDLEYKRGIKPARVRDALDMGSANHRGIKGAIAAYVSTGPKRGLDQKLNAAIMEGAREWAKEERTTRGKHLTDEMRDQIRAIEVESFGIAKRGLEMIDLPAWEIAKWKGQPLFEREIITPLPPWKGFRTIPDLVARRREEQDSGFWLIDWKTRSSFEDEEAEEVNLQFATMQYVLEHEVKSVPLEGSILWQIKAQAPRAPSQNKDGSMSRQAIVTDWATYRNTLLKAKLKVDDYLDMKEKLDLIEWFRTLRQHRSSTECRSVWEQIVIPAAQRMAVDPQVIRRWTHTPFACKGCWARTFCLAELRGEDTDFLLETDYMDTRAPRKRRELGEATRKFKLS